MPPSPNWLNQVGHSRPNAPKPTSRLAWVHLFVSDVASLMFPRPAQGPWHVPLGPRHKESYFE